MSVALETLNWMLLQDIKVTINIYTILRVVKVEFKELATEIKYVYESLLYKIRMYNMDQNSESRDLEQEGRSSNRASKEAGIKKKQNTTVNVAKTALEQGRVHSGESGVKSHPTRGQHWRFSAQSGA